MAEYIERGALLAEAKRISGPMTGDGWDNWGVYALINRQPAADVVERKKGKWEYDHYVWVCSCCGKNPTRGMGYVQSKEQLFPFCSNCGADMRGET